MRTTTIEVASRSDRGRVREQNEDSVAALPEFGLVLLADGMGGYHAGEVASQLAVERIAAQLMIALQDDGAPRLDQAVLEANRALFDAVAERPELEGMATTVVAGLFLENQLYYTHAGDSRLYRLRAGELTQLTRDHSMIQELVDQGMFQSLDEARAAGVKSNILTRGLGIDTELQVDQARTELAPGDRYLFCSDGLSNMVSDGRIAELLQRNASLERAADELLAEALDNGGLDNVSLIVARAR